MSPLPGEFLVWVLASSHAVLAGCILLTSAVLIWVQYLPLTLYQRFLVGRIAVTMMGLAMMVGLLQWTLSHYLLSWILTLLAVGATILLWGVRWFRPRSHQFLLPGQRPLATRLLRYVLLPPLQTNQEAAFDLIKDNLSSHEADAFWQDFLPLWVDVYPLTQIAKALPAPTPEHPSYLHLLTLVASLDAPPHHDKQRPYTM